MTEHDVVVLSINVSSFTIISIYGKVIVSFKAVSISDFVISLSVDIWSVNIDVRSVDVDIWSIDTKVHVACVVNVCISSNSEVRWTLVNSDIVSFSCLEDASVGIESWRFNIRTVVVLTSDVCIEISLSLEGALYIGVVISVEIGVDMVDIIVSGS